MTRLEVLRPAEVCERLGIHKSTLHRWRETNPNFPKPIKIGSRAIGYRMAELENWLQDRSYKKGGNQ